MKNILCGRCGHPERLHKAKGKRKCMVKDCSCKGFSTKAEFESATFDLDRKKSFKEDLFLFVIFLTIFSILIGSIGGLIFLIKWIF